MRQELESGRTAAYAVTRESALKALPDEACDCCGGTGMRMPPPAIGPGTKPCNVCNSTGKMRPWVANYPFSAENVEEFAAFLENCDGFEIW